MNRRAMRENERISALYEAEINRALDSAMSPREIIDYIETRFGQMYAGFARDLPQMKVH